MRPARSLLFFFIVVFLASALWAPMLFKSVHWLSQWLPALNSLAQNPFPRYLNRALMLLAAVGLWPLARSLEFRSWSNIGIVKSEKWAKEIAGGFFAGLGSLAFVAGVALALGGRALTHEHSSQDVLWHLINAGLAAVIVGILEEVFFRGVIFGGFRKSLAWPVALLVSSGIYAALHFLQRTTYVETVGWASGFVVWGRMLGNFAHVDQIAPGFINLTLAGIILGLAYQRTGALYFSIGLHAGWIFWLKSYGFLTREALGVSPQFWGTSNLIDGWLASVILVIVLAVVAKSKYQAEPR